MHSKFILIIHIQIYLSSCYLDTVVVIPVIAGIDLSVDWHWGHTVSQLTVVYITVSKVKISRLLLQCMRIWGPSNVQSLSSSCTDMLKACWWTYW